MQANRILLSAIFVLAAVLTSIGSSSAYAQQTIFDVDLTQGSAGTGVVSGGIWDNGWRVTNEATDRIVFDAGYKIANGYIETTLTINSNPVNREKKINYFGGYEEPHLMQGNAGDKLYLRTGRMTYDFSRAKGAGGPITLPHTVLGNGEVPVLEEDLGIFVTWLIASDDMTELTMKIEWQNGNQVDFTVKDTNGDLVPNGSLSAPTSIFDNYPLDEIRYGFIGGDRTYNISLVGARYLRYKMVDYDATPDPPGNFDGDSDVDGADFLMWQRGFGNPYTASDLANWEMNFGLSGVSLRLPFLNRLPESCCRSVAAY